MKPLTAAVLQGSAGILHWQCTELVTLCNYNSVPLTNAVTVSVQIYFFFFFLFVQ